MLFTGDNTEITTENRPKHAIFDWFFDPLILLKDQIKAQNLSEVEEQYLSRLVLLLGDSERLNNLNDQLPPLEQRRQAEIHAFARRYQFLVENNASAFVLLSCLDLPYVVVPGCVVSPGLSQGIQQSDDALMTS